MNYELRDAYLDGVRARLVAAGYTVWSGAGPGVGESMTYHRRKAEVSKFALVDTFCVVQCQGRDVTPSDYADFSGSVFDFAVENKSWLPRGLFGLAIAHAVMVTGVAAPPVTRSVEAFSPKHWASTEFPALVELEAGRVHCSTATPLWGGAYYNGFRAQVKELFEPR